MTGEARYTGVRDANDTAACKTRDFAQRDAVRSIITHSPTPPTTDEIARRITDTGYLGTPTFADVERQLRDIRTENEEEGGDRGTRGFVGKRR